VRRIAVITAVLGAAVLLAVALAWVGLRHGFARGLAEARLEAAGLRCDPLDVRVDLFGRAATLAPARCDHAGGLVEAVELVSEADATLAGVAVRELSTERLRVVLRDADVRNGTGWAPDLARIGLEAAVAGLLKAVAELAPTIGAEAAARRVDVERGGRRLATVMDLRVQGAAVALREARFGARGPGIVNPVGSSALRLSDVEGTASPDAVELTGRATYEAGLFGLGDRAGRFRVRGTGLTTASPRFALTDDR
jgi:hypothetical protein